MLPTKMFGMGMSEILVILLVAALFLGPEKLPDAATKISKGIRDLRKQTKDLTDTIENDTELGGAIRDLKSALRGDDLRRPPVKKPPPTKAEVVASAAAAVEAAERANLASAAPGSLPPGAPVDELATAGLGSTTEEPAPSAAGLPPPADSPASLVPDAPPPASSPAPAAEPPATAPTVTLAPTAGDPDRDPDPAASDDDEDEHAQLARLVRPPSGAIKRDGHGPN